MSEVVEQSGVTAGSILRDARQASGLHIAALAVALKVPVSKLEALEADDYASLPDTVFVRALASSVCRTLKLEPGPVLSLLPQSQSPRLAPDGAGLNAPVKGSGARVSGSGASSGTSAPRSVVFVVLALLVGAVAVFYFPQGKQFVSSAVSPDVATGSEGGNVSDSATPTSSTVTSTVPSASESQTAGASASTGQALPAAVSASGALPAVATAAASDVVLGASSAEPTAPAVAPSDSLVLRARADSWVQVRDSAGASLLQRKLSAGETVSVNGSLPLSVVVGRADATDVFVRGKPFDLLAVSRENVARFEVKP